MGGGGFILRCYIAQRWAWWDAPDQLTMNRVELHHGYWKQCCACFDFCEDNLDHSLEELDNPLFEDILIIFPGTFNSRSLETGEQASLSVDCTEQT